MTKILRWTGAVAVGLFLLCGTAYAQGTMTDNQVKEYVLQASAQGKDKQTIAAELAARGVTRAQAERVYAQYMSEQESADGRVTTIVDSRQHTVEGEEEVVVPAAVQDDNQVYGRNIFRNRALTFAPSETMATPRNYRLGPGDEVIIDVFGQNETTIRGEISPEGSINVSLLGPVYLNGKTVEEANVYLKKRLGQIYGGLGDASGTDLRLSLGRVRTIKISVLGDVANPGSYALSGLSTALHALYRAGGVVEPGTLRNIEVVRGGKVVGYVDVYGLLSKGDPGKDTRLEDGDVVLVKAYDEMVQIEGMVKRPMFFEMKAKETVADLLSYAGGFASAADKNAVTLIRQQEKTALVFTIPEKEYGSFVLQDGDRVMVNEVSAVMENCVSVSGAVHIPGMYELSSVHTVKGLVQQAGGLLPEAFTDRAVIHRKYDDNSLEIFSVNLTDILAGTRPDFVLQNNDEVFIASNSTLKDVGTMSISGMVNSPDTFPFAENTTIEDLIIMAGGLRDGASTSRVDVTRRKRDSRGLVSTNEIGEMYSFSIKDGLVADGIREFVLEPYDEVYVHQSPSYAEQRHFTVRGEVNFPGVYTLTSRDERVSSLIEKAGGLTSFAYADGARLIRRATREEIAQSREMARVMTAQADTSKINTEAEIVDRTYRIAIDLTTIMANPGSDSDVVLREGDVLEIPVNTNVVRIHGAVLYPTAVNYDASMRGADYIKAAGGFSQYAARFRAYVVSMGGRAKPLLPGTRVDPGSEIFVPEKDRHKEKVDYSGLIAISSVTASLGTLSVAIVSMVNNLKK